VGKTGLQIMDLLVQKAGARGMKIILDRHRPDAGGQSELWYTVQYPEQRWIDDWVMLAKRYRDNPAVIGFDLHNEPHGSATWGDGNLATDWRLAAQRCGNRILAENPNLLIIVEGIEAAGGRYYWWGGNLKNAAAKPVMLNVANQLVYSAHDYPTSVYNQPWFSDPAYPANLRPLWDEFWGHLIKNNVAPVLLGEFGTFYQSTVDRQWFDNLASYLNDTGASFTYWSWNPNSGDTGGILKDDWRTVQTEKQAVLQPLLAPLFR
jgi:endoglucanase